MTGSVGIAHDYLLVMRGAERSFAAIASCWPEAPVYTLLYDEVEMEAHFSGHPVRTSYLQRLGIRQTGFRRLLPLYPSAIERIDVAPHSLLVSSSSAFAHGLRTANETVHVCYCYTPFRYAWHERDRALAEVGRIGRPLLARTLDRIKAWDLEAARRVTHYIGISRLAQERIRRCYGRDSAIVHPPVEVERFSPGVAEDFFLIVCELVRHKRVDVALEACRMARVPVKVVGTGPDLERLRSLYGSTTEFLGRASDAELERLYPRARALIVPNVEEFGIAAVEAQAAGRPVVALAAGGVMETVVDGETGVLVEGGDARAFGEAISETDFDRFRAEALALHAASFSTDAFRSNLLATIETLTGAQVPRAPAVSLPSSARP